MGRKGGRVVCAGIRMSDIPSLPYRSLWEDRAAWETAILMHQKRHGTSSREAGVEEVSRREPAGRAADRLRNLRRLTLATLMDLWPERRKDNPQFGDPQDICDGSSREIRQICQSLDHGVAPADLSGSSMLL
ncbi:hypothetical protein DYH55_20280 [Methylovirgula sp. 4M-Z18]|nr:hypothetical protein DYH55_20280 [Methylovirgula sp. 4M-Z18]